jgi:hypothetical protein
VLRAAGELVALVEGHLPQRVYPSQPRWRLFAAVIVARMADTVEAIEALLTASLPIDGLIAIRTLYEQVIRYLWLSIDPDTHLQDWASNAEYHLRQLHQDALKFGQTVMDDGELAKSEGARKMPGLADLALAVDAHWGGKMLGFRAPASWNEGILTLRGLYTLIYRPASRAAHVQPDALEPYATNLQGARIVVDRPEKDEPSIWWPVTVPLYAHALIVCHDQLGWPDPDRVRAINNAMYSQD